jgi:hypothetical protein
MLRHLFAGSFFGLLDRIKRGSRRQMVEGKGFRLADEIAYIQDKAADHDGRA